MELRPDAPGHGELLGRLERRRYAKSASVSDDSKPC